MLVTYKVITVPIFRGLTVLRDLLQAWVLQQLSVPIPKISRYESTICVVTYQ
jgi:hypothetical protein